MYKTVKKYVLGKKVNDRSVLDLVFLILMLLGIIALLALIYFQVRPIKTVDIKVPVATDKAEYYAGQEVSGIFFGDVYYEGRVEILREVFCKDYRGTIKTTEGDEIFRGTSKKQHLEGAARRIGNLPDDVPEGENCVIQFLNTYNINTPFGNRQIVRDYYTQNFKIMPKPEPEKQAEDKSQEGQREALFPPNNGLMWLTPPQQPVIFNPSPQNQSEPTPTPQQPEQPSEPVQPPERCTVKLLGICVRL